MSYLLVGFSRVYKTLVLHNMYLDHIIISNWTLIFRQLLGNQNTLLTVWTKKKDNLYRIIFFLFYTRYDNIFFKWNNTFHCVSARRRRRVRSVSTGNPSAGAQQRFLWTGCLRKRRKYYLYYYILIVLPVEDITHFMARRLAFWPRRMNDIILL